MQPISFAQRLFPMLLVAGLPAAARAQGTLHADAGHAAAVIRSTTATGYFGYRMRAVRIDGDAIDDLLVTADWATAPGRGIGRVAAIRGRPAWPGSTDLAALPPSFVLDALRDERLALQDLADLDGDGLDEIIVLAAGAPDASGLTPGVGAVAAWRGSRLAGLSGTLDRTSADLTVRGAPGQPIVGARAGDLDGDGIADLALRIRDETTGRETIVLLQGRPAWPRETDLRVVPGLSRIALPPIADGPEGDWDVGEISGDGFEDLVVGNGGWWSEPIGINAIVTGRAAWPPGLDASLPSDAIRSQSSRWHAVATGDVTGDGIGDLVTHDTAYRAAGPRVHAGPFTATGARLDFALRHSRDYVRDIEVADADRDGALDLVVHAHGTGTRDAQEAVGEIRIFRGPLPARGSRDMLGQPADLTLFGRDGGGAGSGAMGDFDGDGRPDVAFGDPWRTCLATGESACGDVSLFLDPWPRREAIAAFHLFVDGAAGDDAASGTGWGEALRSVGEALRRANLRLGPATIRVAGGRHAERVVVGSDTNISGGWRPATSTRNPSAARTVMDGSLEGTVIEVRGNERSAPARLDGLVVTRGRAHHGAGVLVEGGQADIVSCELTGNVAVQAWRWKGCKDPITRDFQPYQENDCGGFGSSVSLNSKLATASVRMVNVLVHHDRLELLPTIPGLPFQVGACWGVPCSDIGLGTAVFVPAPRVAELVNVTIADNPAGAYFGDGAGVSSVIRHSILAFNGTSDLEVPSGAPIITANLLSRAPSGLALDPTNLVEDPRFVDRVKYQLSEFLAGQPITSPAIDHADTPSMDECLLPAPCLNEYSTRTDLVPDAGKLDLGFHWNANEPPLFAGIATAAAEGECAVRVSWSLAVDPEGAPITYDVFRAAAPGTHDLGSPVASVAHPQQSWLDEGLPAGSTWWWLVRARDAAGGRDANLAEASATAGDLVAPLLTAPRASVAGCEATLSWDASDACSGLAAIELHRFLGDAGVPGPASLVAVDPVPPHPDVLPSNGIWTWLLVARDAAGNERVGEPASAWIGTCAGALPPPDRAFIPVVRKSPGAFDVELRPAPGADFHRVLQGRLRELRSAGYTHDVSAGGDGLPGNADDVGACRTDTLTARIAAAAVSGDAYFLARGVNAAGEGRLGGDSFGAPHPAPPGACP